MQVPFGAVLGFLMGNVEPGPMAITKTWCSGHGFLQIVFTCIQRTEAHFNEFSLDLLKSTSPFKESLCAWSFSA